MFGMSVKSVPGCFVAIAPSRIGVPVALTPGFGPHDDVLVETAALELVVPLAAAPLVFELLLLLPQPARTATTTTAARVRQSRVRGAKVRSSCILLTISPPRVISL
jgi:hypothetical protein